MRRISGPVRRAARLLWLASLLCPALSARASDGESLAAQFAEGNRLYQEGNFAAAEQAYQGILGKGVEGAALYYNLGNACFKQGKLGEAIFYWEKARRLRPGDPDIRENLDFANLLVVDRIEVPLDPFPVRVVRSAADLLSVRTETWSLLVIFVGVNAFFALRLFAPNRRAALAALTGMVGTLVLALIVGASLAWKVYESSGIREGVVTAQKVDVRSGPGEENVIVFSVHEGVVVRIRSQVEGWLQIALPNGWNGWVRRTNLREF